MHCRKQKHGPPDDYAKPEKFGDFITADHALLAPEEASRKGYRYTLVVLDRYSSRLQGYASLYKDAHDIKMNLQRFMGPKREPALTYTDGSKEFESALRELGWCHDTSTPYRSQTNGVAERAVRKVKEGTSCTLTQSGFEVQWWPEAQDCYCFLRNVTDVQKDGLTPYQSKFLRQFKGDKIPFGAEVENRPSAPKGQDRLHKYGSKTLSGIFVGYDQKAGGDWSGDYLVADWEEIEQAECAREVHVQRIKEINKVMLDGKFRFPLAEGVLRQPDPGATRLHKRSQRLSWVTQEATVDDDEAKNKVEHLSVDKEEFEASGGEPAGGNPLADKWRITRDLPTITHNTPRTKLFVPTDESCPIPVKYIDVMRKTETHLDERALACIDDFWGGR